MADLKISALTASTVPLAGTEVLPIVQSSTTKQVSVANLTAGRAVSMLSGTVTDNIATPVPFNINNNSANTAAGTRVNFQFNGSTVGYVGNQFDGADFNNLYDANRFHIFTVGGTEYFRIVNADATVKSGNLVLGTSGKGITNSTGSVALNFSTAGTSLNSAQSVLTGSFPNVGSAQTITISDTNGGYVVITGVQGGVGSSTWTLPFAKRGGSIAIGTPSKAILTADPILSVAASSGNIVVTPLAGNTYFTFAIYYTPLGA